MFRGEATPFCYDGGGSWGEGEANEIWDMGVSARESRRKREGLAAVAVLLLAVRIPKGT